ncbi:MAG: hypothetical protein AAGK97_09280, partial [Bacteroidota bacterium]
MKLKACIILIFLGITLLSQKDSSLYVETLYKEAIQIYGFDAEDACLLLTKGVDCSKRNNYMLLQTRGEALQIDCLDFDAYHEDSMLLHIDHIISKAERNYDKRSLLIALANKGGFYHWNELYNKAASYYLESLTYADKEKDKDLTCYTYYFIAHLYYELGNTTEVIKFSKLAFDDAIAVNNNAAALSASKLIIENINDSTQVNFYRVQADSLNQLIDLPVSNYEYWSTLANRFQFDQEFDSAKYYYLKCLTLLESNEDKYEEAYTLAQLGYTSYLEKDYAEAKSFFDKRAEIVDSVDGAWIPFWGYRQGLVEYELGNHKRANELFIDYVNYDEEVYREDNADKMAFYNARFEKLEKENKIQAQTLKIQKQKTIQRNIIFGGGGLALFGSFLIFYLLRRNNFIKKINAQAIELKEQRIDQLEKEQKIVT